MDINRPRENKFRARMVEPGVHEGFFAYNVFPDERWNSKNGKYYGGLDLETVGQFTGLRDKNSKEIYEGDIVTSSWGYPHSKAGEVKFEEIIYAKFECVIPDDLEIVGNIYENSEILK